MALTVAPLAADTPGAEGLGVRRGGGAGVLKVHVSVSTPRKGYPTLRPLDPLSDGPGSPSRVRDGTVKGLTLLGLVRRDGRTRGQKSRHFTPIICHYILTVPLSYYVEVHKP